MLCLQNGAAFWRKNSPIYALVLYLLDKLVWHGFFIKEGEQNQVLVFIRNDWQVHLIT